MNALASDQEKIAACLTWYVGGGLAGGEMMGA